jgi:hypothetical protein
MVDHSRGGGISRHAAQIGETGIRLRQGDAAMLLDRAHPHRAVAAGPRQDDAHRPLTLVLGQ